MLLASCPVGAVDCYDEAVVHDPWLLGLRGLVLLIALSLVVLLLSRPRRARHRRRVHISSSGDLLRFEDPVSRG